MLVGPGDAVGDVGVVAAAGVVEHAHGHNFRPPRRSGDAGTVVGDGGGDARDVGAMPVGVVRRAVVVHKIVPGDELARQIGVAQIDTGIDNGDNNGSAAGADVPRGRRAHHRVRPLMTELRVVRRRIEGVVAVVGFGIAHARVGAKRRRDLDFAACGDAHQLHVAAVKCADGRDVVLFKRRLHRCGGRLRREAHENFAGLENIRGLILHRRCHPGGPTRRKIGHHYHNDNNDQSDHKSRAIAFHRQASSIRVQSIGKFPFYTLSGSITRFCGKTKVLSALSELALTYPESTMEAYFVD